jgi:hypothetical protein
MWAAVAVSTALTLAPGAAAGGLNLKNVRYTYNAYGQERKDADVLPGDQLAVGYDIDGLQAKDDGKVQWTTSLEVFRAGKSEYKQNPTDYETVATLGGSVVPAWSLLTIGTDLMPGDYSVKVTVEDKNAKGGAATFEKQFKVVPPRFGLVRVGLFNQGTRAEAPPVGVPGESMVLTFTLTGYDAKAGANAKPEDPLDCKLTATVQVLDDSGKPTLAKPFVFETKTVPPDNKSFLPLQFPLNLNRSGKFKISIKAEDKAANKTVEQTLDLTVLDVK